MKPFNLEEAKQGKPVITRDGRDARIICFDRKSELYPIIALVFSDNWESIEEFNNKGECFDTYDMEHPVLMMKSEKKKGWINIYRDGFTPKYNSSPRIYDTKEEFSIRDMIAWLEKKEKEQKFDAPKNSIKDDESITSRMKHISEQLKPIAEFVIQYAHWNLHSDEWNQPVPEVPLFRVLDALAQNGKPYGDIYRPLKED